MRSPGGPGGGSNPAARDPDVLHNAALGAPGHPGIPLIFAWGLHIGLSYQRPGFRQESLDYLQRNGLDEPVKWGSNLVDLFPSNKEAHFDDRSFDEHAEPPRHLFREHPEGDQEHRWSSDEFLAFNRHAHQRGFIVTWMIHHWYRYPRVARAELMWQLLQELGSSVCDPLRQGWEPVLDGFMVEGTFFVPEAVCEYLWPYHPGLYYRESMWNYDYTVPNFINPGYHLTDGRDLICDSDYSIKPPESLIGHPDVWSGREHRVRYGRQWVTAQIEARDLRCSEPGWEEYGGMATPDLLVEQINNYGRAKGSNWNGASTTAMRFINEAIISPKMRRYVFGMAQDPVRCAIAAEVTATARTGDYPRTDQDAGTALLQNNHFRLYARPADGGVELRIDTTARGDHTAFLESALQSLGTDLLSSYGLPKQRFRGCECQVIEEAGALASLRQRVEWRGADDNAMSEFRWFTTEADSPWIRLEIDRLFQTGAFSSVTSLALPGYQLDPAGCALRPGAVAHLTHADRPPVTVLLPNTGVKEVRWVEGRLELVSPPARSVRLELLLVITDAVVERDAANWLATVPRLHLAAGEAAVSNPTRLSCMRAVQVLDPPPGVYWIEERGWWACRPAQPSRRQMGTDYCKAYLPARSTTRIRPYGLLEGVCKAGWGCQYMLLFRAVRAGSGVRGGTATVRVVDISPKIFAPRVEFAQPIASATVDGQPWHYFDDKYLFLPQRRGTYDVGVTYGMPDTPRLVATFAPVTATGWDGHTFSFVTKWNEWSDGAPETFRYHAAVRLDGRQVTSVEHAEVVRTVPWFASAEPHDLGGESSVIHMVPRSFHDAPFKPLNPYGAVVVRYLPGAVQLVTG